MKYVEHPLIRENAIEHRDYQLNIAKNSLKKNTFIVLPTGLGKTVIATLIIAEVLKEKGPKILFLAPTRPLVKQHELSLNNFIKNYKVASMTGSLHSSQRVNIWNENDIIVSTPQVIEIDIKANLIDPRYVKLVIFDEAHKSVGKYSYSFLSSIFANTAHMIGFTASPSAKKEKIEEIMRNLQIENLEIRSEMDEDVGGYVQEIKMGWHLLDMPTELKHLHSQLKGLYSDLISIISDHSLFAQENRITKRALIDAQKIAINQIKAGKKEYFSVVSNISMAIKIDQAIEYLETQGFVTCKNYLEKIVDSANSESGSKADKKLARTAGFVNTVILARDLANKNISNPKIDKICEIVKDQIHRKTDSRIIVFSNYREVSILIFQALEKMQGIKPLRFVGQTSKGTDKGLSQKEQTSILQKFKNGDFNVLVSTQVGEEGLDIPETDLVIFNEPISSEIRSIQRRGRTGRKKAGRVVILIYKDTRDEIYYWVSKKKEKRMKVEISKLQKVQERKIKKKGQTTILDF